MLAVEAIRCLALGATAAVTLLSGPTILVFALSAAVGAASSVFRPAMGAILPSVAGSPEELVAANVASSSIEALGTLVGPALAGILVALAAPGYVFIVGSALFAWSAAFLALVRPPPQPPPVVNVARNAVREALAGFRALKEYPSPRLIIALFGGQTIVRGSLNVLIVVAALRTLGLGQPGVGYLNAAIGIGGLAGSVAALSLVGRRRLAPPLGLGLVLWGLPITLLGIWPLTPLAFLFLALIGVANSLVDVAGLSLLQRTVPIDVLARVLGMLEALVMAAIGIGGLVGSGLISLAGFRGAMIVTGVSLPVLTALAWRSLSSIDSTAALPGKELLLLQGVPFLAPLAPPVLEQLALGMRQRRFPAGATIVRQGEQAAQFFVIDEGTARVTVDGAQIRTLTPGQYFGEIGLLRDVPRTATITADTELSTYSIEREPFLEAVTGHARSREVGDAVARAHGW